MSIKADVYSTKNLTINKEEKYLLGLWGLLGLCIILTPLKFIGKNWFNPLLIVVLLVLIIIQTSIYVSAVKYKKELVGIIEFDENYLLWQEKRIEWQRLKEVIIEYNDYAGKAMGEIGSVSTGYDNKISIVTESGEKIKGKIFISSKMMTEKLYELFLKIVIENKISLKNAKTLIHPEIM